MSDEFMVFQGIRGVSRSVKMIQGYLRCVSRGLRCVSGDIISEALKSVFGGFQGGLVRLRFRGVTVFHGVFRRSQKRFRRSHEDSMEFLVVSGVLMEVLGVLEDFYEF